MSASDLQAFQAGIRDRTVQLAGAAMKAIEQNINQNGYYTENRGRVTIKEVCRVAGIGASTLKNRTHKSTLSKVKSWIAKLRKIAPTAKADADVLKRAKAQELTQQVEAIARNYNDFKKEYNELLESFARAEARCLDLESRLIAAERDAAFWRKKAAKRELGGKEVVDNLIPFPQPIGPRD